MGTSVEEMLKQYRSKIKALMEERKRRQRICTKLAHLLYNNVEVPPKVLEKINEFRKMLPDDMDRWMSDALAFSLLAAKMVRGPFFDPPTIEDDGDVVRVHPRGFRDPIFFLKHPIPYVGPPFRGHRYVVVEIERGAYREPEENDKYVDILDWVGQSYYPTAVHFITEALLMGISRRIGGFPRKFVPGLSRHFLILERRICMFFYPVLVIYSSNPQKCEEEVERMLRERFKDGEMRRRVREFIECRHLSEALAEEAARGCGIIRPGKYCRSRR